MQFLIIGRDGDDIHAGDRRLAARPAHLEALAVRVAAGEVLSAAALLGPEGDMRGSMVVCDFPDRAAVDEYLSTEPYRLADVWREVEVHPIRPLDLAALPRSSSR